MLAVQRPAKVGGNAGFKIDWNNRSRSFREKLHQSLEYLEFKKHNQSAAKACETIRRFVSEREKYRLYQKFFPEEWQRSTASFFKTGHFHSHSERANEFFDLVNDKLFPIVPDWAHDPDLELDSFFIYGINFDLCCEDLDWEHLRPSFLAGLLFYMGDDPELWKSLRENLKIKKNDFPKIADEPHPELWTSVQTEERKLYVRLFEIIDHSSGNVWIDTINCRNSEWFDWNEETVRYLSEQFIEAQAMLDSLHAVDDELKKRPVQTIKKLIRLWNTGELAGEKSAKIKTSGEQETSKRLIDILV